MPRIVDWDSHIGRRLSLRELYVFFVVVQAGSLAKAAARLGVTQPAVSQLIAALEHVVGAKLFDRSSRGAVPTMYGRALLKRGRAAFDELRQGIREIEFLADPATGEVKFGCPEGLAPILPPMIENFCDRHPGVVLDIYEEEWITFAAKLRNRSIDFVLQRLHGRPQLDDPTFDDLNVETLFEDELVVAVGRDNPWRRRRKIDLAELVDEPWILAAPPSWNHRIVSEACLTRGIKMPKVVLSTFSTHIRMSMVASGRFVATFPRSVASYYAQRFNLHVLKIELPSRPWPVAILTLKNRTLGPAVELFIEHVRTSIPLLSGRLPSSR
jgi:DNA-binding transcriptional LysR family regulator